MSKNFGAAGHNLRSALATFAQEISTIDTDVLVENGRTYTNLEAYTACRLIPLDENPGVKPIGVGEVLRRIIGKAIPRLLPNGSPGARGSYDFKQGARTGA